MVKEMKGRSSKRNSLGVWNTPKQTVEVLIHTQQTFRLRACVRFLLSLFFVIFLISEIFSLPEVSFVEGDGWEASVFRVVPRLYVFRLLREEDKSPHLLFNILFVLLYFWKFLFSYDSSNVLATVLCPLWFFFTVPLMFRRGRASSLVSKPDLVRDSE